MDTRAREIIREWISKPSNSPEFLVHDGKLNPTIRSRNGETEQVPLEERHDRIVIVPEVPELIKLLVALGAEPLTDAIPTGRSDRHYRQFKLPDSMKLAGGRYSRAGEFVSRDDGKDVHGMRPGTIFAPDNTLLLTINEINNSLSFTVGRTWIQVSNLLATNANISSLPEEVVYVQGVLDDFPMGKYWEKVLNGIDQEGQMSYAVITRAEFLKTIRTEHDQWIRDAKALPGMDATALAAAYEDFIEGKFREAVAELREPLVDFDSRRGDVLVQILTDQSIAAVHNTGTHSVTEQPADALLRD